MSVLVFAEAADGLFKKPAFEAATYAHDLAQSLGLPLAAVVVGPASEADCQSLGKAGVAAVHHVKGEAYATFNDAAYARAIAAAAEAVGAQFIVLPQTYNGRAVAPRLAVKLDAGLLSGVSGLLRKEGDGYVATRTAYSGKAIQELKTTAGKVVLTVKSNAYGVKEAGGAAAYASLDVPTRAEDFRIKSVRVDKVSGDISLTEAEVVVSGGRGLKGPENWGMIEDLAKELKAATACSKPVSDVHWRPHHEHVGQTGIQISPYVYIPIGISGAIQHLAGVSASRNIIVINKDPEAPFFKAADYGVVGDAFDVVPKLLEAIRSYKASR